MPRPVFSLWVGEGPTALALASMGSFAALGHPYTLYAYESIADLPPGVILADAEQVIARRKVAYLLERRAYSMVSNLFRYTRLRSGGLWVDTDVIALRRFDFPEHDVLLGRQDVDSINGAVLGAPAGHPLIAELHRHSTSFRPSYLAEAPWGSFGPGLITRVASEQGLDKEARDESVFYPIPYQEVDLLLNPNREADRLITPETYCVHAWNELLRRRGIVEPPPDSLLERLLTPAAA